MGYLRKEYVMGKVQVAPKDAFMNFKGVKVSLDAADSSALVEARLETGLSIRGGLAWLIHKIEVYMKAADADYTLRVALSTRQGLTGIPLLNDDGTVCYFEERGMLVTEGFPIIQRPLQAGYLPPVPLASAMLSLYAKTAADVATLRAKEIELRIGYTTTPLDAALYTELHETWGW